MPIEGLPPGAIGSVGSGANGPDGGFHHGGGGSSGSMSGGSSGSSGASSGSSGASSGSSGSSSGGSGSSSGASSGSGTPGSADGGAGDGGDSGGITISIPSGFFASLVWAVRGPAGYYSGTVPIGPAQSIEFVIGGIKAGSDYTITLTGIDHDNDPCTGTSDPFSVEPGLTTSTDVIIHCSAGDAAAATEVTTGNVAVQVGVQTM